MRTLITSIADVPEHLVRIAKAAFAVGMTVETYSVRENVVLYANGSFFDPMDKESHALSLMHRVAERGLKTRDGWLESSIQVRMGVHMGVRNCVVRVHDVTACSDRKEHRHRAFRYAIVDALGTWYDLKIA